MKTQKLFNLTFTMQNFDYTFGRNVLEDIIKEKFHLIGCNELTGRELVTEFIEQYPCVSNIFLMCMPTGSVEHYTTQGRINLNYYVISKLR